MSARGSFSIEFVLVFAAMLAMTALYVDAGHQLNAKSLLFAQSQQSDANAFACALLADSLHVNGGSFSLPAHCVFDGNHSLSNAKSFELIGQAFSVDIIHVTGVNHYGG